MPGELATVSVSSAPKGDDGPENGRAPPELMIGVGGAPSAPVNLLTFWPVAAAALLPVAALPAAADVAAAAGAAVVAAVGAAVVVAAASATGAACHVSVERERAPRTAASPVRAALNASAEV